MDEERKKAKTRVIGLFLLYLCIALICFGIAAYFMVTYRGGEQVNDSIVSITKILVLIGIFFLVVDLGYLLPPLISSIKAEKNTGEHVDFGIFDETNMRKALEKYIPAGETLLAGIHAVSNETSIIGVFGKCFLTENGFIPKEDGDVITLNKRKYAAYDIYIGITQHSLVITECEKNKYYYEFDKKADAGESDIQEVTSDIPLSDIGNCFPLSDIQSCEIKNAWMGSVKCFITMKNGSYFKLMLPKLGGIGGGMPHHTEYREAIIERLNKGNV